MVISRIRRWFLFKELEEVDITFEDRLKLRSDRIGILAYIKSKEELVVLKSFEERMREKFRVVDTMYFTHRKEFATEEFISSKQLSWNGKPKQEILEKFIDYQYDQLWVVSPKVTLSMQYLLARIKSRLKLALYMNETYRDCHIFTHSKENDIKNVIIQLEDIMLKLSNHGQ